MLGAAAPARGIFDPSTQFTGVAASPLLMSYSAVAATNDISTQLAAYSVAAGSWLHVSAVNAAAVNSSQPCGSGGGGGASCVASLVHEVSSLVIEADGTLRVLCHSYLVINGSDLRYDEGYIALYSAASPAGPWRGAPLLGWAGASPLSTAGVARVLTDEPALRDCLAFTEPGAVLRGARMLLALGCIAAPAGSAPTIRVVLLASDDAAQRRAGWALLGTLLDGASDAARLGFDVPQLNAALLFRAPADGDADALLLAVSPAAPIFPGFTGYVGCLVFRVANETGAVGVERDAAGTPVVRRAVVPAATAFAGACAATAGAPGAPVSAAGYLLPTLQMPAALFTILPAGQAPL